MAWGADNEKNIASFTKLRNVIQMVNREADAAGNTFKSKMSKDA
jgi:hypothetical protein